MQLSDLIKLIDDLELRMNWSKTTKARIIEFIKQDACLLNTKNIKHRGVDLIIELLQLIKRSGINLDAEIPKHLKEIEKSYRAGHKKNTN